TLCSDLQEKLRGSAYYQISAANKLINFCKLFKEREAKAILSRGNDTWGKRLLDVVSACTFLISHGMFTLKLRSQKSAEEAKWLADHAEETLLKKQPKNKR